MTHYEENTKLIPSRKRRISMKLRKRWGIYHLTIKGKTVKSRSVFRLIIKIFKRSGNHELSDQGE